MKLNLKKLSRSPEWCLLIFIAWACAEINGADLGVQFDQLGRWPGYTRGPGLNIQIVGNLAFVASGHAGLTTWDISNPSNPIRLGGLDTLGAVRTVRVQGNYAYIVDSEEGFLAVDISQPARPARIGNYRTAGADGMLQVSGNYAYLACGPARPLSEVASEGFLVLDISDPRFPRPIRNIPFPFSPYYNFNPGPLVVSGNLAFLSAYGLSIYDISNPASANLIWKSTTNIYGDGALQVAGTNLISALTGGFKVLDITKSEAPVVIGSLLLGQSIVDIEGRGQTVFTVGSGSFEAPSSFWGLRVIDFADPSAPKQIGSNSIFGDFSAIALKDDDALLADSLGGLHVVDVSTLSNPIYQSRTNFGGYARAVQVADGYAYLADANLEVIDITDPAHPRWVSSYQPATLVAVSGNIACTFHDFTLNVIDISDKTNLKTLGSYGGLPGPQSSYSQLLISGDRVFVRYNIFTEGSGGPFVKIFDISDPANPTYVGYLSFSQASGNMAVENGFIYSASSGSLIITDVTNPANPIILSRTSVEYLSAMTLRGNYLLGGGWQNGFQIMDVTDPKHPVSVGKCQLPGSASRVQVSGNHAYLSGGSEIYVVDISDLTNPEWVGSYHDEGEPFDAAVVADNLFIADGSAGLRVVGARFGSHQNINLVVPKEIATGASVTLTATADSGLPVSFRVASGPATIDGSLLTIAGSGEVRLRAEQAGNETTLAAFAEVTINSTPAPDLHIRASAAGVEFFWDGDDSAVTLEKSPILSPNDWHDVIAPAERSATRTTVRIPASSQAQFYRLRRS